MSDRGPQRLLERWRAAGLVDDATVARILEWESRAAGEVRQHRFSRLAFAFGGLLVGAGILLFVAANWDSMSPAARFALVAALVAVLHVGGALARPRLPALATTLHAVGTAALGAGVFLAGQTFNLAEHWPEGLLLWALGALAGVLLLRDWPQAVWLALLGPAWLVSEWVTSPLLQGVAPGALLAGLLVLSLAYVAAAGPDPQASDWRRAVAVVGTILFLPVAVSLAFAPDVRAGVPPLTRATHAGAWLAALGVPLLAGAWLRGRAAWPLLAAAVLAVIIVQLDVEDRGAILAAHLCYALLALGLVWWGVRERHGLRVNLGVLVFAVDVLAFYFSSLYDKLGRALGLIGLGVLFVVGGWLLERVRRRLVARAAEGRP